MSFLNITDTFGLTAPTGGYANEVSRSTRIEKAEVRDEDNQIRLRRPKQLIETDVRMSGKGGANYAAVTAGAFTVDTVKVISAETVETHDGEYPDFTMEGKRYSNRTEAA